MLVWGLDNIIVGGLLSLTIYFVCRMKALGPASKHVLWLVVLAKLVTPPIFAWPWAAILYSTPSESVAVSAPLEPVASATALQSATETIVSTKAVTVVPLVANGAPTPRVVSVEFWEMTSLFVSLVVVFGSVAFSAIQLWRIAGMSLFLRHAKRPSDQMLSRIEKIAIELGVRTPKVLMVEGLSTPMIYNFGATKLLLPASIRHSVTAAGLESVLTHELAHLKRRDHWVGWLEMAAMLLWWWCPIFWLARREIRRYAEQACDAIVVAHNGKARRDYAEAIVDTLSRSSQSSFPVLVAPMAFAGHDDIQTRLIMIIRDDIDYRVRKRIGLVALLVFALVAPSWLNVDSVDTVHGFLLLEDEASASRALRVNERLNLTAPNSEGRFSTSVMSPTFHLRGNRQIERHERINLTVQSKHAPDSNTRRHSDIRHLNRTLHAALPHRAIRNTPGWTRTTPNADGVMKQRHRQIVDISGSEKDDGVSRGHLIERVSESSESKVREPATYRSFVSSLNRYEMKGLTGEGDTTMKDMRRASMRSGAMHRETMPMSGMQKMASASSLRTPTPTPSVSQPASQTFVATPVRSVNADFRSVSAARPAAVSPTIDRQASVRTAVTDTLANRPAAPVVRQTAAARPQTTAVRPQPVATRPPVVEVARTPVVRQTGVPADVIAVRPAPTALAGGNIATDAVARPVQVNNDAVQRTVNAVNLAPRTTTARTVLQPNRDAITGVPGIVLRGGALGR